jgi:hypothetical protein
MADLVSESVILKENLNKELGLIVKIFLKLILEGIKEKKLDWKQQLRGLGIAKASFSGILKAMGEKPFIENCIPILKKNILSNLESGKIQTIEFYKDKLHYAEISNREDGNYDLKVFKKEKDWKAKK